MSQAGLLGQLASLLERGVDTVLVTLTAQAGSTPRQPGSAMLVTAQGLAAGSVGGGQTEAQAVALAMEALAYFRPHMVTLESGQAGGGDGMACGGQVTLLVEPLAASADNARLFGRAAELAKRGGGALLLARLRQGEGGLAVDRALLEGSSPAPAWAEAARQALGPGRATQMLAVDGDQVLAQPLTARGRVVVCGAGHVGLEVSALAARQDFAVTLLDDRAEFARPDLAPWADEVILLPSFEQALQGQTLDSGDHVVIVTRGHDLDKIVLGQALATRAGYIGLMGSSKKKSAIYQALRGEGWSQADLDRVRCPIGLEIGAQTPAEIALSIVAQLVQERAARHA